MQEQIITQEEIAQGLPSVAQLVDGMKFSVGGYTYAVQVVSRGSFKISVFQDIHAQDALWADEVWDTSEDVDHLFWRQVVEYSATIEQLTVETDCSDSLRPLMPLVLSLLPQAE